MHDIGRQIMLRLREALPYARVYWEREPGGDGLRGSVISAELEGRKFTMQFDGPPKEECPEVLEPALVEQVVDDFLDFFARSIYPKEKFTRII